VKTILKTGAEREVVGAYPPRYARHVDYLWSTAREAAA